MTGHASARGDRGLGRRALGRLGPPLAVAALLALLGATRLAVVVAVLGGGLGLAALAVPAVDRGVARVVAVVSHWVGVVLSAALLGLAWLVAFVPAALVARGLGRAGLREASGAWVDRDAARRPRRRRGVRPVVARPFAHEVRAAPTRRTPARRALAVATVVVVVVAADLAVGAVWDATRPPETARQVAVERSVARASLPAFDDEPWARPLLEETEEVEYRFEPFVISRAEPYEGRYVTVTDQGRRTYQPAALPAGAPTVWFFGGSTTYGEGQRDLHTIPSEVARLAESAGTPVRAVNYGERGWVLWQEVLLFEQELAVRPPPDVVVFYDGSNELNVQVEQGGGQPTVYNADDYRRLVEGDDAHGAAAPWWRRWLELSATARAIDRARGPAGALVPAAAAGEPGEAGDDGDDGDPVLDAVAVYERARAVAIDLAAAHGVVPVFFWQPERASRLEGTDQARAAALVSAPTIDVSDALDHVDVDEVFIDGGHTDETGARLVAESLWEHLAPVVAERSGAGG